MNILYIVTDGIETCGGSPVEAAEKMKNGNTNIVLGIIGFNVDANQNKVLNEIAKAGNGYYASANDAAKLTAELQNIHQLAFSDYKWENFDDDFMNNKIKKYHESGLFYNEQVAVKRGSVSELNDLNTLILYGANGNDEKFANLYGISGNVRTRLQEMAQERKEKIEAILTEEYNKRLAESEQYRKSIESRKGEMASFVPSTSRLDAQSEYWLGYIGPGGTVDDMNKDSEQIEKEKEQK